MMRTITIAASLVAIAACSAATSSPDASPLAVDAAAVDAPPGGPCPLTVNEVAAAGVPDDWFELLNVGAAPIELAQFRFTDEAADLAGAIPLPATVLAPGARHVQEVSDAANGFGLGAGDAVWIYWAGVATPCTGVDWDSGDAPAGGSWARVPDGTGAYRTTTPDTRGVANR